MTQHLLIDANKGQQGYAKSVLAGAVGVFVHWFDWAVYAYLATTMAEVFFPAQDKTAGLLSVFAVFAVAFFVRPLGSVIFGHIGDRFGRKRTLSIVIVSMAAGTLLIGIIPGFATIGIWAPILLIIARIIQGLAAGGEFGSAASFLAEVSPPRRRGFGCSWIEFGSVGGFLLASFVVFLLQSLATPEQIAAGWWRVAFIITVPLAFVGLYIRLKIEDTPEYKALEEANTVPNQPVVETFRRNWRELLQVLGIEVFMNTTFYIVLVFLISYQEEYLNYSADDAAFLSIVGSLVAMVVIPISGALSDRFGRKPVLYTAAGLLIVFSVPLFLWMMQGSMVAGFLSTFCISAILAIILGTHASAVAELLPTRTRQSGLSIAYSVGGAFFAGPMPYLVTWLLSITNNLLVPAFILIILGILGVVTLMTMPETRGSNLLKETDLMNTLAIRAADRADA